MEAIPTGEVPVSELDVEYLHGDEEYGLGRRDGLIDWPAYDQQPFVVSIPNGMMCFNTLMDGQGRKATFPEPIIGEWERDKDTGTGVAFKDEPQRFDRSAVKHLDGTLVVTLKSAINSFHHWFNDVLPCYGLVRGLDSGSHRVQVPINDSCRYRREHLSMLGYAGSDVVNYFGHECVSADNLIFAYVGSPRARWVRNFHRRLFWGLPVSKRVKRIYLSREDTGWHKPTNDAALAKMLSKHGFEKVLARGHTQLDMAVLFNSAEFVVTAHGSGMMNLCACRGGAKALQLWHPDRFKERAWWNAHYPPWVELHDMVGGEPAGDHEKYLFSADLEAIGEKVEELL